jgi:hypothetical protein
MDFTMDIDTTNPRKRGRVQDDDEPELGLHHLFEQQRDHVAKRARHHHQSGPDASPRDSTTPPATPSNIESGPSTPASIDVDMDLDDDVHVTPAAAAPAPASEPKTQQPQPQPQPRSQGTIISGWNQAQRNRYLNQGYPLSWIQGSARVGN